MDKYKIRCRNLKKNGYENKDLNEYKYFKDLFSQYEFNLIMNEKQKRKNKRYRTKNHILEMYNIALYSNIETKIVFGTCTLNNKSLNQKEDTYIRKLNKWLKEHFLYSINNKDFGSKTEREHYHFIGITTEELENKGKKSKKGYEIYELKNKTYNIGFEPTLCVVDKNIKELTNYFLKLNNHSNKLGTKNRVRVIKSDKLKLLTVANSYTPLNTQKKPKYGMVKFDGN